MLWGKREEMKGISRKKYKPEMYSFWLIRLVLQWHQKNWATILAKKKFKWRYLTKKICAPLATMAKALFTNGNPVWIKCGVGAQSAWLNILLFKPDKFRKRLYGKFILTIWKNSISRANRTYQPNLPTLLPFSSVLFIWTCQSGYLSRTYQINE